MPLANYANLTTAVASWLHRDDLTANIPDFITMAQIRLSRDLRIAPLIASTTLTISPSANTGVLPADFVELINVQISPTGAELHYVPLDTIDRATAGTVPWVYTLRGSSIIVGPAWSAGGTLAITYIQKLADITDANQTNWLITNAPDLLLYASLLEASPYLMDDQRIEVWEKLYTSAVKSINVQYGNIDPHLRMKRHTEGNAKSSDISSGTQ
jgi:hypothetical protein